MRLNWFSPLPPARTDIANYTARLLPPLAAHAEVKLWAPQEQWTELQRPSISIGNVLQKRLPWTEINFREFSIFQIGNDARFHGPLLDVYERHGGIVVLHDTNLHEMQRMRLVEGRQRPEAYLALLSRSGGAKAVAVGRRVLSGEISVDEAAAAYPLTDSVLQGAHGVVVHNPTQLKAVATRTSAPCLYLPLPYLPPEALPEPVQSKRQAGDPLRLILFGFLHGTNRRLESILQAWAQFPQRDRLRLTLFGEYDQAHVSRTLEESGLRQYAELHGYCSESEMDALLSKADLALNLRFPSRGEASGSLLRIWSHALPCFVSRSGYYAELDDALVTKIDPGSELIDLHHHWSRFLTAPEPYLRQGSAGLHHLKNHHTPAAYVERLMAFLPEAGRYRAQAYLERWLPHMTQKFMSPIPHWAAQARWRERIAAEVASWAP